MTLAGEPIGAEDLARLAKCGISAELAQAAMLRRVDTHEGGAIVGRNGTGDYAGILFPYIWPGENGVREYRLRRDHPELEQQADGSVKERAKYLSPPGRGNMLYLVPGTDPSWLNDPNLSVLVTEGEKKTLALWGLGWHDVGDAAERPRWLPVGLSGVWNFRGTVGKAPGPNGDRRDVKGVIPDLNRITWKGRHVVVIFDANVRHNESVRAARFALSKELQRRGARVFFVDLPEIEGVNGIDDLIGVWKPDQVLDLLKQARPAKLAPEIAVREFNALGDDRYRLSLPSIGVTFEIDRLRRDHHELVGELCVRCELPGARSVDGTLSIADFNLSSARARSERARLLAERSNTRGELDWTALVEEFSQKVLQADRAGQPALDLRDVPKGDQDDGINIEGLAFPARHPSILFGDGGAAKSYTALYLAGRMAQDGKTVALFDWELAGDDHRERLERLFGPNMPRILYARCERPLVFEADRLRRIVRDHGVQFTLFDSVAFACDGPPEAAEVASRYFRAVRQIGGGSLHIAHINKGENADKKPFGSTFWHNGARSTWFVQKAEESPDSDVLKVGFFNRKANLGRLRSAVAFTIMFGDDRTTFRRSDVADSPDLAGHLSVRERMRSLLRRGPMTLEAIAENIEAELDTVKRTQRRYKNLFVLIPDGRLALLERHAS